MKSLRVYPAAEVLDGSGNRYAIGELDRSSPTSGHWVTKNDVRISAHALALDYLGGKIWALSPRTRTWWNTPNGSVWTDKGPVDPAGPPPTTLTLVESLPVFAEMIQVQTG